MGSCSGGRLSRDAYSSQTSKAVSCSVKKEQCRNVFDAAEAADCPVDHLDYAPRFFGEGAGGTKRRG
jgi:hypothetical protein